MNCKKIANWGSKENYIILLVREELCLRMKHSRAGEQFKNVFEQKSL